MVTEQEQFDRLFAHILGHQAAEIAAIGVRSGLFRSIAEQPGATSEDVAAARQFDVRYVSAWTTSAFAHGFIDRTDAGGYVLAEHMERLLLDPTAPTYLGGRFRLESAIDADYRRYPDLLASGATWPRSEHETEMLDALADSSTPDGAMVVGHVLPQLPSVVQRLRVGGAILEIGAGAGVHTVHYARTFPASHVVALEFDGPSAALAQTRIDVSDVADRVQVRRQDANDLTDRQRFDLVTMNIVLHETGDEDNYRNVLRRCFDALRPGGGIVVSELPYPDDVHSYRSNPIHRRLAGVQLHEAVVGCGAITQRQLLALVEEAGFDEVRVAGQPRTSRYVVVGTKPRV